MSLDTWKAEFYPTPATTMPWKDALDHSIRKWSGLTKENLAKHGLISDGRIIHEFPFKQGVPLLYIDSTSCALCESRSKQDQAEGVCDRCPLYKVRNLACDKSGRGPDIAPYYKFTSFLDPIPMLTLLEKAKAFV